MRVLQIHNTYREAGGEDSVVRAEAALLRELGDDVHEYQVANPDGAAAAAARLAMAPWNPVAARAVVDTVERLRPDVVHLHNTWFSLSPAVPDALIRRGVPLVATVHNYRLLCANAQLTRDGEPCELCVGRGPWNAVRFGCYRNSAAQSAVVASTISLARRRGTWAAVDVVLALTRFARERLVRAGIPENRIELKPNFTPDPGLRPEPPSRSNQVVFVGRLSPEKGVANLLRAWADAPPQLELAIVGDGPLRTSLESMTPERVSFLGSVPPETVRRMMLSARALVVPSVIFEGQPMVQVEALGAGLPMVASNLGGVAETAGGDAGWLVDPTDSDAWAAAFTALLDDDRVDAAGRAARVRYQDLHTPQRAGRHLHDAYRRAIDRHRS